MNVRLVPEADATDAQAPEDILASRHCQTKPRILTLNVPQSWGRKNQKGATISIGS